MDFSQFFRPGGFGSWAQGLLAPAMGQGILQPGQATGGAGSPMNIMPAAAQAAASPGGGSGMTDKQANGLFSLASSLMNQKPAAAPPPLQVARPVGLGMLHSLGGM